MKLGSGSRTVLVILLGVAVLELGITRRFGAIWSLAFTTPKGQSSTTSSTAPATQAAPAPAQGVTAL